jgi:hypothetical protein
MIGAAIQPLNILRSDNLIRGRVVPLIATAKHMTLLSKPVGFLQRERE